MSATNAIDRCDVAILSRIIQSGGAQLPATAARFILKMDFTEDDRVRMHELARKARAGALKREEQDEIEDYERVGHLLALMHSKARVSLKKRASGHTR